MHLLTAPAPSNPFAQHKEISPGLRPEEFGMNARGLSDFFKKEEFTSFSRSGSNEPLQALKNDIIQ